MRYAHTLLFVCPGCNLPVAISRISNNKNLEQVDEQTVSVRCSYCDETSEVFALTAKVHWVTDWSSDPLNVADKPRPSKREALGSVKAIEPYVHI